MNPVAHIQGWHAEFSAFRRDLHMGSIPSIIEERTRLAQIDGAMPRLDAVPGGCAFHPRCTHGE